MLKFRNFELKSISTSCEFLLLLLVQDSLCGYTRDKQAKLDEISSRAEWNRNWTTYSTDRQDTKWQHLNPVTYLQRYFPNPSVKGTEVWAHETTEIAQQKKCSYLKKKTIVIIQCLNHCSSLVTIFNTPKSCPIALHCILPGTLSYSTMLALILRAAFQLSVFYTYVHARKSLNPSKQFVFNK